MEQGRKLANLAVWFQLVARVFSPPWRDMGSWKIHNEKDIGLAWSFRLRGHIE